MNQQEELEEGYAAAPLRDKMPALDGARVLWGRVVALVFLIGWSFVLGRCSAPEGVPTENFRRVNQELTDTRAELERVQEQRANQSPAPQATGSPSPTASPSPAEQIHTVESGDTLREISLEYYETPNLANFIAEANNLRDNNLRIGQRLIIPPKPADNQGSGSD